MLKLIGQHGSLTAAEQLVASSPKPSENALLLALRLASRPMWTSKPTLSARV